MLLRLRACFQGITEAEGQGNALPRAVDAQDAQPARNSAACINLAKDASVAGSRLQAVTAFQDGELAVSRPCHDIRTARRCLESPIDSKSLAHMGETGLDGAPYLGARAWHFQRQSTPDVLTPTCDVHGATPLAEIDVQLRCSAAPAPRTEVPNAASRPGRTAPSAGSQLRSATPPSLTLPAAEGSSGAAERGLLVTPVSSTLLPAAAESQTADGAGGSDVATIATLCSTAAATAANIRGYSPTAVRNASMNGECPPDRQLGSSLSVGGARGNGGDTGGNGAGLYTGGGNDTAEVATAAVRPAVAPAAAALPTTAAPAPVLHLQIPRSLSEPTPTGRCLHRCGPLPTVVPVAAEVAAAEPAPAVAAAVAATEPLPRPPQLITTVAPRLQLPQDGAAAAAAAATLSSACNCHAAASAEQQQVLPPAPLSRRRHPRVASRVQGPLLAATCDRIAAVDEVGVASTVTAAAAAGAAGCYGSDAYTDTDGLDGDYEEEDEDDDEDADDNVMSLVIRHVMRVARRHHVRESRAACGRLLQALEPAGRGTSASGLAATGAAAGSKLPGAAPNMPVKEPVAATDVEAAAAHASHLKCSSSSAVCGGDSGDAQRASYSLSALHYGSSIAAMAVGNGPSFCPVSSCEVASEDVSAEMAALAAAVAHQQQQPGHVVAAAAAAAGGLALVGGSSVAGAEVGGWVERVSRTSLNEALHDRQREVAAGLAAAAAAARGPSGGGTAAAVPAYTSRRRTEVLSGMCVPPVAEAGVDNRASSQVALMRLLRIGEPAPAFAQGGGQPYANDGRNLGQHHPAGAAASHALAPLLPGERPQAQPLPQQLRGVSWLCRNLSGLKWLGEGGGGVVFQAVWHGAHVAVKLMAADVAAHVDATALEAVVGLALGHPNVVTTYCADVCLMTEPMELMLHSFGVDSFSPTGMASSMSDGPFTSGDGFGEPDPAKMASAHRKDQIWSLRQVLSHLGVRPGRHLTWMVMEHCDRGSLMQAIQRGIFRMPEPQTQAAAAAAAAAAANRDSPLPFSRRVVLRALLRTAREVAQGMCHLHANGIIHGDLKPGNVLLRGCRNDRRGFCALVSDFGLSKVTPGGQAVVAHNWSTVTAQAPETFAGQWLPASDVWSFGILLWQLVAGEDVPYRHLAAHEVAAGVSLGLLVPEWPLETHPSVLALGYACLSPSPERRPTFKVIVKALIEIEQSVRNEARVCASAPTSSEQE